MNQRALTAMTAEAEADPVPARVAYIKNGDVIDQYERYRRRGVTASGPDAFVSAFLARCAGRPLLLLSRFEQDRELIDGSVSARVYGDGAGRGAAGRLLGEAAAFAGALRRLLAFRPDAVVCGRSGPMLWAAGLACRWLNCPLVHARHTRVTLDSPLARVLGAVDGFFMRRAAAVVCHGPFLRDQLAAAGVRPERIHTFDVALTAAPAEPGGALDGVPEHADVVLYAGRIKASKGVFELLDACLPLLAALPELHLVYLGDGPDFETLAERVRGARAGDRVHLLGRREPPAVAAAMKRARLLATPTRHAIEGRSMAVMEGLVAGLPVVAPDSGPFPYLVDHEINGLLYRTDSVGDLRRQIERVVRDPALQRQLANGARASGEALLAARPPTFVEAVQAALSAAGRS